MLNSERTFKIKVRLPWTAFKIFLTSAIICIQNVLHTTNVTNLAKVIQESSYRVLQVTYKQKTIRQSVYFLKAVEFGPIFDIQIDITLAIFREKLQNHTLQKSHRSLSRHTNIYINRATHYVITAFQKYENFAFFWRFLFPKKIADIWKFQ